MGIREGGEARPLFRPGDGTASWIAMRAPRRFRTRGMVLSGVYRGDHVQSLAVYFHKTFTVRGGIRSARASFCGLGFHEMFINGGKVGDRVLDPAPTDYRKRALGAVFDVTHLVGRRNEILVVVGNGRHFPAFGGSDPKLIARIDVEIEDGRRLTVGTDETWRAGHGPIRENGLFFGEVCDGRIAVRPARWKPAKRTSGPRVEIEDLPPARVCETADPRRTWRPASGRRVYDFGRNFAGWVKITARGARGTRIVLRHAELIDEKGELNTAPNQGAAATDVYVCAGRGRETYEPRFTQHGFRYAEVEAPEATLRSARVEGRIVHTDLGETGRFRCSHPLINRIHDTIRRGLLSNLIGIPTDCPQRDERQGWLADAHVSAEAAILNFDMAGFYRKFLRDIRDAQGRDGAIPDFVPPYMVRFAPADPAWGSAYITLAWLLYWYTGDTGVLAEHFNGLRKYVDFLHHRARGGIIESLGKYGDWCPPGSISPKRTPLALTSTWFYAHDTLRFAEIARILGREREAADYGLRAQAIRFAFNRRFLKNDGYETLRWSPIDRFAGQTSNALPLWLGLVPEGRRDGVLRALLHAVVDDQDCHLDTGILGTRYLLEVLSENGRTDVAFRVATQTSYPSWGYMIREGATTLWERWEKITSGGMNSHNHIMLGSIDAWCYKYLAGVRCAALGWSRIIVEPPVLEGLDGARAALKTVRGRLAVSWKKDGGSFLLEVTVPEGAEAEVRVPLPAGASGRTDKKAANVDAQIIRGAGPIRQVGKREGRINFLVSGGRFSFCVGAPGHR